MTTEAKHPPKPKSAQHPEEAAIEYARRAIHWLGYNDEDLLLDLKTTASLFELFDLIAGIYDVSTLSEVYEVIEEGEPVAPLRAFIKKHKLGWRIPRAKARGEA